MFRFRIAQWMIREPVLRAFCELAVPAVKMDAGLPALEGAEALRAAMIARFGTVGPAPPRTHAACSENTEGE